MKNCKKSIHTNSNRNYFLIKKSKEILNFL